MMCALKDCVQYARGGKTDQEDYEQVISSGLKYDCRVSDKSRLPISHVTPSDLNSSVPGNSQHFATDANIASDKDCGKEDYAVSERIHQHESVIASKARHEEHNRKDRIKNKSTEGKKTKNLTSRLGSSNTTRPCRPFNFSYKSRHKHENRAKKILGGLKESSAKLTVTLRKRMLERPLISPSVKREKYKVVGKQHKIIRQEEHHNYFENKGLESNCSKTGKYRSFENTAGKHIPRINQINVKTSKIAADVQRSGEQDFKRKQASDYKNAYSPKSCKVRENVLSEKSFANNMPLNRLNNTLTQKTGAHVQFHNADFSKKFKEISNISKKLPNNCNNFLQKFQGPVATNMSTSVMKNTPKVFNHSAKSYSCPYNHPNVSLTTRRNMPHSCQLTYPNIPFVVGKSTTPSHNLGINVQTALSLIKTKRNFSRIAGNNHCLQCFPYGYGGGDSSRTQRQAVTYKMQRQAVSYKALLSKILAGEEHATLNGRIYNTCQQFPAVESMDHEFTSPECVDLHQDANDSTQENGVSCSHREHEKNHSLLSVMEHLYEEFKFMNARYQKLKQTTSCETEEDTRELEQLEAKLQAKEDEINVMLHLFREAASLRQQLQALAAYPATSVDLQNCQPHPLVATTTNTVRLTKVLKAVQRFQDHLKDRAVVT